HCQVAARQRVLRCLGGLDPGRVCGRRRGGTGAAARSGAGDVLSLTDLAPADFAFGDLAPANLAFGEFVPGGLAFAELVAEELIDDLGSRLGALPERVGELDAGGARLRSALAEPAKIRDRLRGSRHGVR